MKTLLSALLALTLVAPTIAQQLKPTPKATELEITELQIEKVDEVNPKKSGQSRKIRIRIEKAEGKATKEQKPGAPSVKKPGQKPGAPSVKKPGQKPGATVVKKPGQKPGATVVKQPAKQAKGKQPGTPKSQARVVISINGDKFDFTGDLEDVKRALAKKDLPHEVRKQVLQALQNAKLQAFASTKSTPQNPKKPASVKTRAQAQSFARPKSIQDEINQRIAEARKRAEYSRKTAQEAAAKAAARAEEFRKRALGGASSSTDARLDRIEKQLSLLQQQLKALSQKLDKINR